MIAAVLLASAIPGVFWAGDPASASELPAAGVKRIYAPPAQVEVWKKQGVTALPESSLKEYTTVPPPKTQMRNDVAAATSVPWWMQTAGDTTAGSNEHSYSSLPPGSAGLAAAEAHAYGVDAVLAPDAADLPALRSMLAFLRRRGSALAGNGEHRCRRRRVARFRRGAEPPRTPQPDLSRSKG